MGGGRGERRGREGEGDREREKTSGGGGGGETVNGRRGAKERDRVWSLRSGLSSFLSPYLASNRQRERGGGERRGG